MPSETIRSAAVAHLRAAGLPEPLANTLADRVVGVLESLRRQAEALPLAAEPAVRFVAARRAGEEEPR